MVLYVIVVTCLVTFFMNKLTNIVIPTYVHFIQMPTIETKFGIIYILTNM